ncbi:MAG: ribosome maturation factor RimM [Lachnospiraceae bacterium]|nr:ribosome maturation factor RimM [Lachnospiraceae bacterium]
MEERFKVGIITGAHGVHGEVKVFPTTDDPRRFKKLKEVILCGKGGERTVKIVSVKLNASMVILKLEGTDDRDAADRLKKTELFVDRKNAVKLEKDEYFIADLIGMKVVDEDDRMIGELWDVIQTGANDVYSVRQEDGRDLLIPAIKECILSVDVNERIMKVHIMEGLI